MDTLSGKKLLWRLAVVLPVLLVCLNTPVHAAQARNGQPPNSSGFTSTPGISIERATAIARRETGGRVLSATPKQRSTGTEYRIRMLVDGERVITVTVDERGRVKNRR